MMLVGNNVADADVAIIGAGPYGLSVGAHLSAAGIETQIFGEPMSFWERNMPAGMFLRSPWAATHLSDPQQAFTLEAFQKATRSLFSAPVPLPSFVRYGRWFQREAFPDVDRRLVSEVEANGSFRLLLADGQVFKAKNVVVAAGIESFPKIPPQFSALPRELATHSSEHRDFSRFKGKGVVVIGAGQSALESAALLNEAGAKVEILVRESVVHWLRRVPWLHDHWFPGGLLYAPPDVGPAGMSHMIARPNWYRRLPRKTQDKWGVRAIRPAGAAWLRPRLANVPITTGVEVIRAAETAGRMRLHLSNGTSRMADHVLLGTGYQVNIGRYQFLPPQLLRSVRQTNGYPQLSDRFEASVPGLFFAGASAAWSFGPLMRFVAGAEFTARSIRRALARSKKFARKDNPCPLL